MRTVLFQGCSPQIAAGADGQILAVGAAAVTAAGPGAALVDVAGETLPGLADAHLHLHWLALQRLNLEVAGTRSLEAVLEKVRRWSEALPARSWVVGRGWYNDLWPDTRFPNRRHLDAAAGGRPAILTRKDGHSAWASSAALAAAGLTRDTPDPPGGVIDRDGAGEPTGIVREKAIDIIRSALPSPTPEQIDRGMLAALTALARMGLTSVHGMDTAVAFASLQRLHAAGKLPIRVTLYLPAAQIGEVVDLGIRSGLGDDRLRVWGLKGFLDGSLGSRTAEMLDGSGVAVLGQPELVELIERAAAGHLNVALHAIGDRAVRRALDALEPLAGAWSGWRPRIEHAQSVHPDDWPRFARAGAIASMQPIHAVADRELADREWGDRSRYGYAWRALEAAGARLAFGSDAPVESADPLLGIEAATTWRRTSKWYPELALSRSSALRAYTSGAAYAVGMEDRVGRLRSGWLCDLTIVEQGRVVATVVGGRVVFRSRRRRPPTSPASGSRPRLRPSPRPVRA